MTPKQHTGLDLRAEIIALWSQAGLEMDDVRLKLFDRMSPSLQRYIVAQVRSEVRLGHPSVRLKEPSPQMRQMAANLVMGIPSSLNS